MPRLQICNQVTNSSSKNVTFQDVDLQMFKIEKTQVTKLQIFFAKISEHGDSDDSVKRTLGE